MIKNDPSAYIKAGTQGTECRFCGRRKLIPCRNTRDMSPDEFNRDLACHTKLAELGGGEYGFKMSAHQ